ncbi:MAG: insulinase family protein [Myxococcales bacterium FL481]|nr:MAG: insulinase family protein [Myxococcales bacterium FL481]
MLSLLASALLAVLPAAPAPASAPATSPVGSPFPYPRHVSKLDNGLTVIVVPMSSGGLVSYRTAVRTGARDEYEPGRSGFAHFFEHMMFRGTEKYPQAVYSELVTRMGADSNAYTSTDVTVYEFDIAAEDLARVVELESDRFQNLAYSEAQFRTEAGAVYGEYRKNRSSPFFVAYEALHKHAFVKHTYGHTAMGHVEDIQAMPTLYDYSKTFFQRHYRPENCVIVIAGDVEPTPTIELIRQHYAGWAPGYVAPPVPREPRQTRERTVKVAYEGRTLPILAIGYKADAYDPRDTQVVASMLLAELAFGATSELYRKLSIDEQVVQSLSASAATDRDPGLWTIWTMVKDPAKVDYVRNEIDKTIAVFRKQAPTVAQLDAVRSRLRYAFLMELDTPANVAGQLAYTAGVTGGVAAVDDFFATLDRVTPADINGAAERYLVKRQRTVVVVREKGSP